MCMILGVNTSHNASFCLVDDEGDVQWLLEEERFCRLKDAPFATLDAIDFAIRQRLLDPAAVDTLVYSFEMEADRIARCDETINKNVRTSFGVDFAERFFRRRPWDRPL